MALHPGVERRLDGEPATEQALLALLAGAPEGGPERAVLERPADVVAEVRGRDSRRLAAAPDVAQLQTQRLRRRRGTLRLGQHAHLDHAGEHQVAPGQRRLRVVDRVEPGRALHDPGEQRSLRQGQRAHRAGEVEVGGGAEPVRAVAVVGDVQVAQQDLVLAEPALERHGVPRLAQLALEGDLGGASRSRSVVAEASSAFLTYCCVSVEPPCSTCPDRPLRTAARTLPFTSTPRWS
jgi:hypothetical protein